MGSTARNSTNLTKILVLVRALQFTISLALGALILLILSGIAPRDQIIIEKIIFSKKKIPTLGAIISVHQPGSNHGVNPNTLGLGKARRFFDLLCSKFWTE